MSDMGRDVLTILLMSRPRHECKATDHATIYHSAYLAGWEHCANLFSRLHVPVKSTEDVPMTYPEKKI
jgi:hypothetical protein